MNSKQFQIGNDNFNTKRSPFKKSSFTGSSSLASNNNHSTESILEEIIATNENDDATVYNMDSFEETISNDIQSSTFPTKHACSKDSENDSDSSKTISSSIHNTASTDGGTCNDYSKDNTVASARTRIKQHSSKPKHTRNSKCNTSCSDSWNDCTDKYELRRNSFNSKSTLSSQNSNNQSGHHNELLITTSDSEHHEYDYESHQKKKQFHIKSHLMSESKPSSCKKIYYKTSDVCSKKRFDEEKSKRNAAVQTIYSEPDNNLSTTFIPILLKDIEANMEKVDAKQTTSSIVRTHVELIKRQATREKRILEEWSSAINDLEEQFGERSHYFKNIMHAAN
ncbi:unnamed protein product [Thelazia callipaeda]|uniref:Uncharacterized protein n=1 Tax=Thelazia callipaeda TaxID=103827 RepID=A0A0N5CME5_THECL|nr:unnamed protein product [Thelazia callipaeda]